MAEQHHSLDSPHHRPRRWKGALTVGVLILALGACASTPAEHAAGGGEHQLAEHELAEHDAAEHDHSTHDHGDHDHEGLFEVPSGVAAPQVSVAVHQDPMSGWNVEVVTSNFTFAPEQASTAHRMGRGHAHLYVDGKKLARLYAGWFHIDGLAGNAHHFREAGYQRSPHLRRGG